MCGRNVRGAGVKAFGEISVTDGRSAGAAKQGLKRALVCAGEK